MCVLRLTAARHRRSIAMKPSRPACAEAASFAGPLPTLLTAATLLALGACNDAAEPLLLDGNAFVEGGVLTVRGDAGPNDIRFTSSAAGVRVELDGASADIVSAFRSVAIDTGAGDDVVRVEQSTAADLELAVASGEGDDQVTLSFHPADDGLMMTVALAVESGPGSDRVDFLWDGAASPDLNALVTLETHGTALLPEQGDEVLVSFEHGDPARPVVLGGLWNGSGPDDAPGAGGGDPRSMELVLDFTEGHADVTWDITGGAGPDDVDVEADYSGVTLQQGRVTLDTDVNEGDNHVGKYIVTSATHTYVDTDVRAGDGDNVLDLEHVLGGDGEHTFVVEVGEGTNETSIRFGDGVRGARPATGARNVTATYRSGGGQSTVVVGGEVVEPLTSALTVDHGSAETASTTGRYKLEFPWDREAPPGAQLVPSQTKVIVLAPSGTDLDFQVEVGDAEVDEPGELGLITVQAAAAQQTDLDFLHERATRAGTAEAEEAWTLRLADGLFAGDASLVVDAPPGLDRLVYLQDGVDVEAGAAVKVELHADGLDDAVLAHLLGVTAAGRYELMADGGPGNDLVAALTRDLVAEGAGEMAFTVSGADGDDVLGLGAPDGLDRQGPIVHAIAGGAGTNVCFTAPTVPATECSRREEIGEELLDLLERAFGAELADEWRK